MKTSFMKTKNIIALFLVATFAMLTSCDLTRQNEIGNWSDNIKLTKTMVEFNAEGDSVTIQTGGSGWWINNISVNGKFFHDKNHLSQDTVDFYRFRQDCFTVERRTRNHLFIKLDENTSTKPRDVYVHLQAGNYFSGVRVIQKAK